MQDSGERSAPGQAGNRRLAAPAGENAWIPALRAALGAQGRCVLVTVAQIKGSTPREAGAKMVVWPEGFAGSIGGGNLEYAALGAARGRMAEPDIGAPHVERVALGPSLGQCCGGSATLLMESVDEGDVAWLGPLAEAAEAGRPGLLISTLDGPVVAKACLTGGTYHGTGLPEGVAEAARRQLDSGDTACRIAKDGDGIRYLIEPLPAPAPSLLLFGAGHVGQALAPVLAGLPFRMLWIDERVELLPKEPLPGMTVVPAQLPALIAGEAPAGSYFLVMTHSHARDLEICERVLQRGDFAYLGLIGSATKRERFERRFRSIGIDETRIDRLTCPIGIAGIDGKSPAEIAVAVAAELLQRRQASAASSPGDAASEHAAE